MPPSTAAAADAAADALRRAIAAGQDAEAARLLRLLEADGAQLPPATFVELAAAGLPQAAVALAQLESGVANLREATDDGGSYLHAAAAAGAGAAVVAALVAAGGPVRSGWEVGRQRPRASQLTFPASPHTCPPLTLQAAPSMAGMPTRPPPCTLRHVRATWTPAVR